MPKRTGVEIAALETVVLERVNVCHPFQDALLISKVSASAARTDRPELGELR